MADPRREAPPGLHVPPPPSEHQPFDHQGWVMFAAIVSVVGCIVIGWWRDDWYTAAAVAGGFYVSALLTIIALKD